MGKCKFVIDASFWEVFPDAEIGIVLAMGIDNTLVGQDDVYYGKSLTGIPISR